MPWGRIKPENTLASREDWIGRTGQEWAKRAEALDLLLGPAGDEGLRTLAARPGERILDLGCGSGASTAALAAAVTPAGLATGVDVSPDLVALARTRLESVEGTDLVEADAERQPGDHREPEALVVEEHERADHDARGDEQPR